MSTPPIDLITLLGTCRPCPVFMLPTEKVMWCKREDCPHTKQRRPTAELRIPSKMTGDSGRM